MKIQLDLINTVILMTMFFSFEPNLNYAAMYACEKLCLIWLCILLRLMFSDLNDKKHQKIGKNPKKRDYTKNVPLY